MRRLTVGIVAMAAFVAAFGVAEVTGVRLLGGAILIVGAVLSAAIADRARTPWWRILAILVLAIGAFALSHVLAGPLGAWPSVIVVAMALGIAATMLTSGPWPRPRREAR